MKKHMKAGFGALLLWLGTAGVALADGVLVFGGTGRLGSEIVRQLINAGESEVTVFARPTSDRARLKDLDVNYVTGDVLVESDVETALKSQSFRVVINALSKSGNKSKSFYEDSQKYISKWSKETGVDRIVLNSSVGAGKSRDTYPEERLSMFGDILDDKERAEENVTVSGVNYTILRNYRIIEEPAPITGLAYVSADQMSKGSISRGDLAILNVYCLRAACANKIYHAIQTPL